MSRRLRRFLSYLAMFAALCAFYAATFDLRNLTDTHVHSLQTRALVLHGDVDLTRYPLGPKLFVYPNNGHIYSEYGVGISVVAAPFYAVTSRLNMSDGTRQAMVSITFVAAAIVTLFPLLVRLTSPTIGALAALVLAAGTPVWSIATTAMHQTGPMLFFQAIGLTGLFSEGRRGPLLAGVGFGGAAFVRPQQALAVILVGLFYLIRARRSLLGYVSGALPFVAGIAIQNRWLWGNWLEGGYANNPENFSGDVLSAMFGLLLGWWRGIFVYTPVLALAIAGILIAARRWRDFTEGRLLLLGMTSIAVIALYSFWTEWWGGINQFGYRFLLEIAAFFVILGAWAVHRSERLRPIALGLGILSVANIVFGMAPNRYAWDQGHVPSSFQDAPIGQAWIAFFDNAGGSLLRLAGIAVLGALFLRVASKADVPVAAES